VLQRLTTEEHRDITNSHLALEYLWGENGGFADIQRPKLGVRLPGPANDVPLEGTSLRKDTGLTLALFECAFYREVVCCVRVSLGGGGLRGVLLVSGGGGGRLASGPEVYVDVGAVVVHEVCPGGRHCGGLGLNGLRLGGLKGTTGGGGGTMTTLGDEHLLHLGLSYS
jgi:hypothetical protein